jgi:hypothetical protein
MPENIFRYVVRYDMGTAPRPFGGVCSLAVCKPKIRASAKVGDWIIGFRSQQPDHVVYVMRVDEVLPLAEYWNDERFRNRRPGASEVPDNFYRSDGRGGLAQVANKVHSAADAATDISGRNVLLSEHFWYFGNESVRILTELAHLAYGNRGHVVHKARRADDVAMLRHWLAAWKPGVHGSPTLNPRLGMSSSAGKRCSTIETKMPTSLATPIQVGKCKPRAVAIAPEQTMGKLIFSRKGFDSGYGGMPSPILPDGRLVPLPIPSNHDDSQMADVATDPELLGQLLGDLSGGKYSLRTRVHLDPDLVRGLRQRPEGWRPALGQSGAAQSHLAGRGVGQGDVFLFFGWFRQVQRYEKGWRYEPSAPNLHVLSGWLEIGDVLPIADDRGGCLSRYPWISEHVHLVKPQHYTNIRNTLYIAPEKSRLVSSSAGGGQFARLSDQLILTSPGESRSIWSLPDWFMPKKGGSALSYHGDLARWTRSGRRCRLRTVGKGQEFVLDLSEYPNGVSWLTDLIRANGGTD